WELVSKKSKKPGHQFAAITDPGTSLEKLARERGFRWTFLGQPDIGGRYSVLSYFGMAPAALAGYDYGAILDSATGMPHASAAYGADRLFVYVRMANDPEHAGVRALERAGQPVVTLTLRDRKEIGGEFLRWEIATAVAGHLLQINAFDQPNVQESKDNTKKVL